MKINRILMYLLFSSKLFSQYLNTSVLPVSQTSNYHFYQSKSGLAYIGSLDGLNVFDGLDNKIYRPNNCQMIGNNIQGEFIEDAYGQVWFATYEGLHFHDQLKDAVMPFQFKLDNGDAIETDYRVIHLNGDTLWVGAGNFTFLYDVIKKRPISKFETDLSSSHKFLVETDTAKTIIYAAGSSGLNAVSIDMKSHAIKSEKVSDLSIRSFIQFEGLLYLGTFSKGLFTYNLENNRLKHVYKTSNSINSLLRYKDGLMVNVDKEGTFYYKDTFSTLGTIDEIGSVNYTAAFITEDNVLWEGIVNKGPRFRDLCKSRFKKISTISGISCISKIDNYIFLGLRGYGYTILDSSYKVVGQTFDVDQNSSLHSPSPLVSVKKNYCFYHKGIKCLSNNLHNVEKALLNSDFQDFISVFVLVNNDLIIAPNKNYLLRAKIEMNTVSYDTVFRTDKLITKVVGFENRLFASHNDERIICLVKENGQYKRSDIDIDITGEIKFVGPSFHADSLMISTVYGLYVVNRLNYEFRQIIDKDKFLLQTIYAAYPDSNGYIWCSSNSGILRFNQGDNQVHQFSKADGIQGNEFNTHAHLQLEDGTILFGGINGLNIFHPDSVTLSDKNVPVVFTAYNINDKKNTSFGAPFGLSDLTLSYDQNTVSFAFHAIDYGDPQATRVKYKLSGVDKDYVVSENAYGFTRYANLQPGSYTLSVIGANSDKVWNSSEKIINISIKPPWWQTWWFRFWAALTLGSLAFGAIRYYYQQQLAKKDYVLKTQALVIEKQTALQNERTRIAGEMHDDLGGGLTTIRFLSQKLLRNLNDETQKSSLQKIVDHSQDLVNNMSEIIWAMNSGFDTLDNLIAYSRRYAREFLDGRDIQLHFKVIGNTDEITLTGEKRRNVFLVIKEALHNVVKHSQASNFYIKYVIEDKIVLVLKDDGIGLNKDVKINGNGLLNISKRVENLGGKVDFNNDDLGLEIVISLDK